jgi:uncharacterized protein YtpQ (UPF0354 family)
MTRVDISLPLPYLEASSSIDETAPFFAVASADAPVVYPWMPNLLVTYVIDATDALVPIRERDIEGVTREQLHATALANLRKRAAAKLRVEQRGSTFVLVMDGKFEASTLLLDELWDAKLRVHVQDAIVVCVPARNVVAFTSTSSPSGIDELVAIVQHLHPGGENLLVQDLFVRGDRGWDPYQR